MEVSRTFHDYPDITHKTMHDTQRLGNSHPGLILGQSVQSLENCLDLALSQQLFGEFLCRTYIEQRTMYV